MTLSISKPCLAMARLFGLLNVEKFGFESNELSVHIIRGKPIKSPLKANSDCGMERISKMRFNKMETIKISF